MKSMFYLGYYHNATYAPAFYGKVRTVNYSYILLKLPNHSYNRQIGGQTTYRPFSNTYVDKTTKVLPGSRNTNATVKTIFSYVEVLQILQNTTAHPYKSGCSRTQSPSMPP